jgi:hypothetical protein
MTPKESYDNQFFCTNVFLCCFWVRDPGWVKIRIRDPGSATLHQTKIVTAFKAVLRIRIRDPGLGPF